MQRETQTQPGYCDPEAYKAIVAAQMRAIEAYLQAQQPQEAPHE